jgi:hypothetical protein
VQVLLQPTGTTRVYLGTSNWNDRLNRDASAQVLYRDAESGPWLRTGAIPAPTSGASGRRLCEGFDQVNDLRTMVIPGGQGLLLAALGSSYYADANCWSHANVVVSTNGGASWASTGLENVVNAHVPFETTEARYILVHGDATPECGPTPCVFATVGVRGVAPMPSLVRFGGVWRARIDPTRCAATGGLCWDTTPLITFSDPNARSKMLKGNMVSVGQSLLAPTDRCESCPDGPRIYLRNATGAWSMFYQAPRGVEQIRALYYDEPTRRLYVAMNFQGSVNDRVYRFDTVGDVLSSAATDEGLIASYPYQLAPFVRDGRRYLVATAAGRNNSVPHAALSVRDLDAPRAPWQIIDIPALPEDPVVAGLSTSLRFVVPSPWHPRGILAGGYDATLSTMFGTTPPHLTAQVFLINEFTSTNPIVP